MHVRRYSVTCIIKTVNETSDRLPLKCAGRYKEVLYCS